MNDKGDMGPFAGMDPDLEKAITRYGTEPYRRNVTVSVHSFGHYSFDDLPDTINEWLAFLDDARKQIPAEFYDTHRCVVSYESGYYDSGDSASFDITYERPETDEEMIERVRHGIDHVRASRAQERATYEALKRKYEDT